VGYVAKAGLEQRNAWGICSFLWGKDPSGTLVAEEWILDVGEHLDAHPLQCGIKPREINGCHLGQAPTTWRN
jgi:hypothetical protein